MNTTKTALRRLAAGAGALALAMTGAIAAGTAAWAAVGPDQPGAPSAGTLTINKYAGDNTDTPNPEDLLDGVEFTVTQVGRLVEGTCTAIDLTDAPDWEGLDDLFASAPDAPATPFCLTSVAQDDVTEDGRVVFDLAVGVYFVQETDPGDNPIVSVVPNFYVSIPTAEDADADGWNYNVVADPKNQLMDQPSKTIENQTGLVVGDTVTWTLTVPIPSLNEEDVFESASVTDALDSRLSYASSSLSIGDTDLEEGTHYTVDEDVVTWTFVGDGLDLLYDHQGEDMTVTLVTTVDEVGDGSIPNDDYSSSFNDATVPGQVFPYTYWGQLSILKTDDSAPALNLKDAQFKVFLPNASGRCDAEAPASGALATGTSDENGVVQWAGVTPTNVLGLWIANSPNGALSDASKDYCVYETVAPAGHSADPAGKLVTITPGAPVASVSALTVVNPKTEGPVLPLTGAGGTLVMTIGGLLLIGVGAGAIVISRRRRHNAA